MAEIWTLVSTSPENFRGGGIWSTILSINGALRAIAYGLLALFFVVGMMKTCSSFTEMKRPEVVFKVFIRFALTKAAISHCMELLNAICSVVQGAVSTIISASGITESSPVALPNEMAAVIEDVGLLESIPLWAVTLLGSLLIWVLSLIMILTVYSRFFRLYMATAIAPIPLSSFAGEPSSSIGKAFLKSYAAICLEGCIVVLACVIFSSFAATAPVIDDTLAPATIVWNYVGEIIFNMLVLVGTIKMSSQVVRELLGLWPLPHPAEDGQDPGQHNKGNQGIPNPVRQIIVGVEPFMEYRGDDQRVKRRDPQPQYRCGLHHQRQQEQSCGKYEQHIHNPLCSLVCGMLTLSGSDCKSLSAFIFWR